ncbi:MAG: hypothetical protein NTV22_08110 [bacterium]|nr:hypothetical protein [bacterium]
MKKLLVLTMCLAFWGTTVAKAANWGFWDADRSWIGIHTKISNVIVTNWYTLWNAGAGTFVNANLGTFNPSAGDELRIAEYNTKTWKGAGGDVTGCEYLYIYYEDGQRGKPSSTSMGGGWLQDLGDGNQKWGSGNVGSANIAGSISTVTNRLEIYGYISGATDPVDAIFDDNNSAPANYDALFYVVPEGGMVGLLTAGLGCLFWRKR